MGNAPDVAAVSGRAWFWGVVLSLALWMLVGVVLMWLAGCSLRNMSSGDASSCIYMCQTVRVFPHREDEPRGLK